MSTIVTRLQRQDGVFAKMTPHDWKNLRTLLTSKPEVVADAMRKLDVRWEELSITDAIRDEDPEAWARIVAVVEADERRRGL